MSFTEDPGRESPGEPAAEPVAPAREETRAAETEAAVEQEPSSSAAQERAAARERARGANMLPERERRRFGLERVLVRFIATLGIVGIGVAIGAILVSSKVQGWITGLAVAVVSVVLSAILWSSKQL